MPSHYEVLGVACGASPEAIRAAYRELAKVEHPDVKPSADASRMVQINLAFRVLSDPASRAAYDRTLSQASPNDTPAGSARGIAAEGGDDAEADAQHAASAPRPRRLSGLAYAVMVVATIIAARRLAAPSGESEPSVTPAPQLPAPQPPALTQPPRDPCPPIRCPPGATEHEQLAGGGCKRWCTDAHGQTLASSSTRSLDDPTREPADPQQLMHQRLSCRAQPGRAPTCSLGGGDIELGTLPAAAISGWQVVLAEGAAPAAKGTRCELRVLPVPAAVGGDLPYNCRLDLRCGVVIYGGGSAGFGLCDVVSGVLRGAVDPLAAASDGDAALLLDMIKGRLVVADTSWRLSLAPLMAPPKGPASD